MGTNKPTPPVVIDYHLQTIFLTMAADAPARQTDGTLAVSTYGLVPASKTQPRLLQIRLGDIYLTCSPATARQLARQIKESADATDQLTRK